MNTKIHLRMNVHQCYAAACYDDFGWPNCRELKLWYGFCAFDGPTKGCLLKSIEHLLGIAAALLLQHRLNATCSSRLLTQLKPHPHIFMYKSAAAFVSTHEKQLQIQKRAAKFTKNKNDQWNHAGGFSISICAGLSLKMQPRNNWLNCRARCMGSEPPKCRRLHASGILRVRIWKG